MNHLCIDHSDPAGQPRWKLYRWRMPAKMVYLSICDMCIDVICPAGGTVFASCICTDRSDPVRRSSPWKIVQMVQARVKLSINFKSMWSVEWSHLSNVWNCVRAVCVQAMLEKVPGKDVTVHVIAARVRMDMKVGVRDIVFYRHASLLSSSIRMIFYTQRPSRSQDSVSLVGRKPSGFPWDLFRVPRARVTSHGTPSGFPGFPRECTR